MSWALALASCATLYLARPSLICSSEGKLARYHDVTDGNLWILHRARSLLSHLTVPLDQDMAKRHLKRDKFTNDLDEPFDGKHTLLKADYRITCEPYYVYYTDMLSNNHAR